CLLSYALLIFFSLRRRPLCFTLFPYTTLFRSLGWTIFGVIWGLALGGVVFKAFFVKKYLFTSTILYVLMGWLVVLGWHEIKYHRSEEHTSELQSRFDLVCRLLLEKKKIKCEY